MDYSTQSIRNITAGILCAVSTIMILIIIPFMIGYLCIPGACFEGLAISFILLVTTIMSSYYVFKSLLKQDTFKSRKGEPVNVKMFILGFGICNLILYFVFAAIFLDRVLLTSIYGILWLISALITISSGIIFQGYEHDYDSLPKCPHCGWLLSKNAEKCPKCGKEFWKKI